MRNTQCFNRYADASRTVGLALAVLLAAGHGLKADEYTVNYNYAPPYVTVAYTNPSNPSTDITGQSTAAIPFSVKDTTTGSSFTGFCVDLYHDQYNAASYSAPAYSVAALAGSSLLANAFPYTAYTDLAYRMNYMGYVFSALGSLTEDAEVAGAVQLALWTLTDKNFSYTTSDTKLIADTKILLGLLGVAGANGVGGLETFQTSSGTAQVTLAGYSMTASGNYSGYNGDLIIMHPTPGSSGVNQNLLSWSPPSINLQSVPEPSSFAIAGLGALAFAGYSLRRRAKA